MNLEGTKLSEISQTEKENMMWSHLYVGSSMILVETEKRLVVARDGGQGLVKCESNGTTSSYNINVMGI